MSKTPNKAKSDAETADAPKRRSKLKLAVLALVPLVLAGGGYAGWAFYFAPADSHAGEVADGAAAAEGEEHGTDMIKVSAVPTEIAAETSFTHSYALSVIVAKDCGVVPVEALKAASEEEAKADGLLVSLSWTAAARRTIALNPKTCRRFLNEVVNADAKAAEIAAARFAAAQDGGKGGHGSAGSGHDATRPEKTSGGH